jgi:hypothetical protein
MYSNASVNVYAGERLILKTRKFMRGIEDILVQEEGLEPPLSCENEILSLARLPVPPFLRCPKIA